jgi:hypothetical protein
VIPEGNNVYGRLVTPLGLQAVLRALESLVAGGRAWVKVSGYDGSESLHLETASADFLSTPLEDGSHLYSGGVGGTEAQVLAFVQAMSDAVAAAGIWHSFEVYDEAQELIHVFPG